MDEINERWREQIQQEYKDLLANEDVIHNQVLHQRILTAWRLQSPAMWSRLQAANLTEALAYVVQQRMWTEEEQLMAAGLPFTDAREQAEREHLMLEPEAELEQAILEETQRAAANP
jgi:hypothetical protein